jgi:hypothetical protein
VILFKITEIICIVDEFHKEYYAIEKEVFLGNPKKRASLMLISEAITFIIVFQLSGFRTFKYFYILAFKSV